MSEVCSDKMASPRVFSIGDDSTDSDFIQDHVDSFFPPADSEEVMDEDFDESLNREGDDGIPDFIQLIPWTGFEMDETSELLSSLVNWVKDFVRGYIEPIFEDIKNYMDEYIEGVIASYEKALEEYEKTESISEETAKEVFDSLMDDMFYIIFGLTTALMAVFTVLEGVSLGAGSIAMIAVPLLITMIIDIFGETVGEAELPGLPTEFDVDSIIEYAKNLVGMEEDGINSDDASDALWSIASIVFGWYGLIGGAISLEGTSNPGIWSIYSVVCGFISLLFGFYSLGATGLAELITGGIALIYGTASSILGVGATLFGPTGTIKGAGIFGTALGMGATVSGGKAYG